jgi:hypothetical protein
VSEEKELNDIGLNCETRPLPSVASALDRSRKWYFSDHCSCRMNSGSCSNPKDQAQALGTLRPGLSQLTSRMVLPLEPFPQRVSREPPVTAIERKETAVLAFEKDSAVGEVIWDM